ncbi:MAG TPA: hypothetical protein VIT43_11975 [Candidatus Dormibacteraeota bacterium]
MSIPPIGTDAEETDRLDLRQLDLIVSQLGRAGQAAGETGLAGAFRAGAMPAQEFEVVRRLMPVRPLDR